MICDTRPLPGPKADCANTRSSNPHLVSLPIVEHIPVEIGEDEQRDLAQLARNLLADEPALCDTAPFGSNVEAGLGPWPSLVLEDHSRIALFEGAGNTAYSYRALLLAGEGDQVVIGIRRSIAFEEYCRDVLRLGRAEILAPAPATGSLAVRCNKDSKLLNRIAERARANGGLNIVTYMGTGGIWALASRIAELSGGPVRVAAPPPRLTRRVNDKLWFSQRVEEVLGPRAMPPAQAVFNLAALAGQLAALSERYANVAVKLPDSASSAGNIVLDSRELRRRPRRTIRDILRRILRGLGWSGGFPLMVTAWEQPIIASPSVQVWVPRRGVGVPIVEGIFDQTIVGKIAAFSGAEASALPQRWQQRLAGEAARLAYLFQELGYFGRCSLDSILVGTDTSSAELHWVECNGRWGGVSIPMTLANRLVGDWIRHPPVIVERCDLKGPSRDIGTVLAELENDLFWLGRRSTGVVVLSPGPILEGTGFELMVIGDSVEAARAQAEAVAARLAAVT